MSEEMFVTALEQIRSDAILGKKKHFNAADRKEQYNTVIGILLIILNVVIASNLFYTITSDIRVSGIIVSLLGITATIFVTVQAFFNYSCIAQKHKMVAINYLHLANKCSRMKKYYIDGNMSKDDLTKQIETFAEEYDQITTDAVSLSTSRKDYENARNGINEGEEIYSEKDLQEVQ
ncbi:SLATT domain-containing protein [Methanogenium organophilum]|uniref:SLATT domain-containing protein n=1 Tax=Methanogenium organophilum TaxID=2199 RepID=A0A9X9T7Z9_METOG|nr:SLATT domain-containing protein [Methanogenium organophilum]WAI00941.1 SLATT domain-containing protein [Methanogenium organophilum]